MPLPTSSATQWVSHRLSIHASHSRSIQPPSPPHTSYSQERDGLLIGPYEGEVALHTEWPEGPPSNFAFDLFPPALERIESCLLSAMELIPALETVGFRSIVNGPTIWTGDSLARCGRTCLPGYYDFNSLTYGGLHTAPDTTSSLSCGDS